MSSLASWPYILVAEQAVRDELGIIDALRMDVEAGDVLSIAVSRRERAIAEHLHAQASMFERLAIRTVQELL